jgi:DNA-binding response OmpR family regulator
MSGRHPYAVIIDSDPGMALSLQHLFQVICDLPAEIAHDIDHVFTLLQNDEKPAVLIIGRVDNPIIRNEFIRQISQQSHTFVLVIDRQDIEAETVQAFLAGADDVLRTPFTLRELALRLRARIGLLNTNEGRQRLEDSASWDSEAYIANQAGLTSAEAQIAHILISHSGEIVSRDELSHAIDQRPWDYGDRKFDVHVAKIRKKLNAVFGEHISVDTVRAAGYILKIDEQGFERLKESGFGGETV